jgi:hypothetical protein
MREAGRAIDHIHATFRNVSQAKIRTTVFDWSTGETGEDDEGRSVADDDTRRVGWWIGRRSHD